MNTEREIKTQPKRANAMSSTFGPDVLTLDALAARVPHGASLALPPDYSGCAMAAVKALIRHGVKDLHVTCAPTGSFMADWLIGAGAVKSIEAAAMSLGEHGLPPRFAAALKAGTIIMRDSTCPAIHAGLMAAEKAVPFMPLRGILGSDLLKHRPDWKVIDSPYGNGGDPVVLLPAIRPDIALFHARKADTQGNVWVGVRRELMLMAHAARTTLVTVEEIVDTDFLADDMMGAGTIPALYLHGIAVVPGGADPIGLQGAYPARHDALAAYAKAAQTDAGFKGWAAAHIHDKVPA